MAKRVFTLCLAMLLFPLVTPAKDKKPAMPGYIRQARTVAVIIDPQAGMSIADPQANQVAQKDVETALLN